MRTGKSLSRTLRVSVLLAALVPSAPLIGANLILNGDFENNTASATMFNMQNALFTSTVAAATAFGTADEIDLITGSPFGLPPVSGNWKVAIHRSSSGNNDAFSLDLSAPVVAGQSYVLDFFAQRVTTFDAGVGAVQVGISGDATAFGTLLFSGVADTTSWTHFTFAFLAPVNGQFLTVQIDPDAAPTWAHLDNFSLTAVPEPTALALLMVGLGCAAVRRRGGVC
jgi:hypothetical protein